MEMRELKAGQIADTSRIVFATGVWLVPSQTTTKKYRAVLGKSPSCTCEDFQLRQLPCKHILAARIACARDFCGITPEPVEETVPEQGRKTYPQVWPAYNQAQQVEKERLRELLYDLCRDIPQSPAKPGRGKRPMIVRDAIFAAIYKVYSTFSGRRFMTDLEEARESKYLSRPVSYNSIFKCLEDEATTPILHSLIERSSLPLRTVEVDFAFDSSGFCTTRYTRWFDVKYGIPRAEADWVKVHIGCGVKTNVVTSAVILDKRAADCPQFPALINTTAKNFKIREASADMAYTATANFEAAEKQDGKLYAPFKSDATGGIGGIFERMFHYFSFHREEYLAHYHKRSNVESTFSAIKRKLGEGVRSKTDTAMRNEVLAKLVAYNICVVIQEMHELGIEADFWPETTCPHEPGPAHILKFPG